MLHLDRRRLLLLRRQDGADGAEGAEGAQGTQLRDHAQRSLGHEPVVEDDSVRPAHAATLEHSGPVRLARSSQGLLQRTNGSVQSVSQPAV